MTKQIIKNIETQLPEKTEAAVTAYLVKLSKEHPNTYVTAYGHFGEVDAYIYTHMPRTDTPDTRQTYRIRGGVICNGKVVKPGKTWMKKHNFCPVSR